MSEGLRLCIVGAGSSYTPELIEGLFAFDSDRIPVSSIHLHDIDPRRLEIMAGLSRRMLAHTGKKIAIRHGTDLPPLLEGAQFVITQIRVGGMEARHIDESIPLKYGIIGQETTGPGGMFKALRTIPAMLDIAHQVEKYAPNAFILNYTNPSGIITEAVQKYSKAKIIGLCSGIPGLQEFLSGALKAKYPNVRFRSVGLNHLGFVYRITCDGADITKQAIKELCDGRDGGKDDHSHWLRISSLLGAFPMRGYSHYFYYPKHKVDDARLTTTTRAQAITEIEKAVFADAADPACHAKPASLAKRGGQGYSDITFAVLGAICRNSGEEFTVSTRSNGAVSGIAADTGMELTCKVDGQGATPLPVGDIPLPFRGIVTAVKSYEQLTVEAAVNRCRKTAFQALLAHPLVSDMEIAEPLLDEMLALHQLQFA